MKGMKGVFYFTTACVLLFQIPPNLPCATIGFEDLTTRATFLSLGILNSYEGFEWGYGDDAGIGGTFGRTFVDDSNGWASATTSNPALAPVPSGISGTSYAWNSNAMQSLWIDFKTPTTFNSADFAILASGGYAFNSSTIQLFGYDASDVLLATTGILTLSDTMQTLRADFVGIRYLEIRANPDSTHFSVDSLRINESIPPSPVPDACPSAMLLTIAIGSLAWLHRRCVTSSAYC
jgi:hypothetical protein